MILFCASNIGKAILLTSTSEPSLVLLQEGVCHDQCILLAKFYYPLPCFILYSKAKVPVTPGVS